MPIVRVEMWAGGSRERKRKLAAAITDAVVDNVGCPGDAVTIIFDEISKEDWVIGGTFASDRHGDGK